MSWGSRLRQSSMARLARGRVGQPISKLNRKKTNMLYTIAIVLIVLWLLGLVSAYTIGGFIHLLLVVAVILVLVNLISGRKGV